MGAGLQACRAFLRDVGCKLDSGGSRETVSCRTSGLATPQRRFAPPLFGACRNHVVVDAVDRGHGHAAPIRDRGGVLGRISHVTEDGVTAAKSELRPQGNVKDEAARVAARLVHPPSLQVFPTTVSENCVDHAALRTEIVRLVGEARSAMAVAILKLAY